LALVAQASFVDLAPTRESELDQLTSVPFTAPGGTAARAGNGTVITQGPNDVVAYGTGSELVVDVAGAVQQPGLHRLRNGDRVADAIDAAGGYAARVDLAAAGSALNLAELLTDGAKVVVPELGMEAAALGEPADGRIDLNTADQAALESLPGIGPVTAGKIMAARSARAFASVGELLDRDIVGQAVYDDIVDLVRVSL
jgi:competence protein ComEA